MDYDGMKKSFMAYEYKEIVTQSSRASFLMDVYENFGWEVDNNLPESMGLNKDLTHQNKVILRLKRNRKIVNKMELTRLERNFEACVKEIEALEKSKTSAATIYALIVGILGTAFMAGSVFAVTSPTPNILLCILFAIPGFIGWIIPCFIYKTVVGRTTEKVVSLTGKKYDEIYEICEKGNKLLH